MRPRSANFDITEPAVLLRLPSGLHTLIDAADLPLVARYTWNSRTAGRPGNFHAIAGVCGEPLGLHRLLIQAPDGYDTDHINGCGLDNRRKNLRVATRSENASNRHIGPSLLGCGIVPLGVPIIKVIASVHSLDRATIRTFFDGAAA